MDDDCTNERWTMARWLRPAALVAAQVLALSLGTARGVRGSTSILVVSYSEDRLTVQLQDAPLAEVLEELGKQSGASIRGQIPVGERVSRSFEREPLVRALERLLSRRSFFLQYDAVGHPRRIEILSSSERPMQALFLDGDSIREEPDVAEQSPFDEDLIATSIDDALHDLTLGSHAGDFVAQVVQDDDPSELLVALKVLYPDAAAGVLERLATGDGPTALQPLAREALETRGEGSELGVSKSPEDPM